MKYNKLYFMHIPKTGGRYMIHSVIDPIRDQIEQSNVKILNTGHFDHSYWHSEIDDQTYVVSILRDPFSHTISLYSHKKTTNRHGDIIKNKNFNLRKNEFYNEIKSDASYQNFQSKCFMMNELHKFPNKKDKINIDEGLIKKRINRVNLLLNSNNLNGNSIKIQEKIFLDLGINGDPKPSLSNKNFYNNYSKDFYGKFSNAEKSSIEIYNKIDYHIYQTSNYFRL